MLCCKYPKNSRESAVLSRQSSVGIIQYSVFKTQFYWRLWTEDYLQKCFDHLLLINPFCFRFVIAHNAMTQYILGDSLHIGDIG